MNDGWRRWHLAHTTLTPSPAGMPAFAIGLRLMIDFVGYGSRLAAVVGGCVGAGGLVGVHVHGSAVLGGFRPERSDVDVLVVVAEPVLPDRQGALGAALLAAAYPCPGIGLELSVITAATAADLGDCRFEVHVGTPDDVVIGAGHRGDDDLILYAEVCRQSGLAVVGPAPALVFGAVPRPRLVTAMLAELEWGVASAPFLYAVLNACRALGFAADGTLRSKVAGGEWYLAGHPDDEVVLAALARQRGDSANEPLPDDVRAFVDAARRRIGQASR
jgi:streptomycin 3"-adenylyltransferase